MTRVDHLTQASEDGPGSLRTVGRLRVLEALAGEGPLSRPDLIRLTGLARATVSSVTSELSGSGMIVDVGTASDLARAPGGRPARLLGLAPDAAYAIGVDIGHDRVRCMLCDLTGAPLSDEIVIGANDDDPDRALGRAAELVSSAITDIPRERILGIGLGLASPLDQRTGELYAEGIMPGWVGWRPADVLSQRSGFPVRIINDANAGALAERRYGAAVDSSNAVYVRLSTGVGMGVVCDGRVLLGSRGLAGELGHVPLDERGVLCRCGNRGCLETIASPVAIAAEVSRSRGRDITTTDLLELVRAGDRGALRVVADAGYAIGRAVAMTVMVLNPEVVVVGGELAAVGEPLLRPLKIAIERHAGRSQSSYLDVRTGALDDTAGARGAAALVLDDAPQVLAQRVSG